MKEGQKSPAPSTAFLMNDTDDDDNGNVERLRDSRWLGAKYLLLRVHCVREKADSQAVTTTARHFVEKYKDGDA